MNKPHKLDDEYSPKEYKEIQSLLKKVDKEIDAEWALYEESSYFGKFKFRYNFLKEHYKYFGRNLLIRNITAFIYLFFGEARHS